MRVLLDECVPRKLRRKRAPFLVPPQPISVTVRTSCPGNSRRSSADIPSVSREQVIAALEEAKEALIRRARAA